MYIQILVGCKVRHLFNELTVTKESYLVIDGQQRKSSQGQEVIYKHKLTGEIYRSIKEVKEYFDNIDGVVNADYYTGFNMCSVVGYSFFGDNTIDEKIKELIVSNTGEIFDSEKPQSIYSLMDKVRTVLKIDKPRLYLIYGE